MINTSISEAKAKLSFYLQKTIEGEEVIINNHNKPIAKIIRIENEQKIKRKFGLAKNKIKISADFNKTSSELEALFYNSSLTTKPKKK